MLQIAFLYPRNPQLRSYKEDKTFCIFFTKMMTLNQGSFILLKYFSLSCTGYFLFFYVLGRKSLIQKCQNWVVVPLTIPSSNCPAQSENQQYSLASELQRSIEKSIQEHDQLLGILAWGELSAFYSIYKQSFLSVAKLSYQAQLPQLALQSKGGRLPESDYLQVMVSNLCPDQCLGISFTLITLYLLKGLLQPS